MTEPTTDDIIVICPTGGDARHPNARMSISPEGHLTIKERGAAPVTVAIYPAGTWRRAYRRAD